MDNRDEADMTEFIHDIRKIDAICVPAPGVALRARFTVAAYKDELYQSLGIQFPSHLNRAVAKRKAEYLCGRFLAALALEQVVGCRHHIGSGEHRQPLWPSGVTGSISHTSDVAACLLSASTAVCLGIDIENVLSQQTADNVAGGVICDSERALLKATDAAFALCLTAVFSAKETVFKALYPRVGFYFDFNAALVTELDFSQGTVALELTRDLGPVHRAKDRFQVRLLLESGKVLSYLVAAIQK